MLYNAEISETRNCEGKMIRKNEEYVVQIIDNGFQGEGIAKIDGQVIFVPGGIKDAAKSHKSR